MLPAGTQVYTLCFATTLARLPADTDTHARTHFAHPLLSAQMPFSFVGWMLKLFSSASSGSIPSTAWSGPEGHQMLLHETC